MNKINGKRKKARSLKINLPFIIPEQFLFFDPSFNFLSRNKRPKTGKRQLDESLNFLSQSPSSSKTPPRASIRI